MQTNKSNNESKQNGQNKRKFSTKDLVLITITAVLLLSLITKSVVFDAYTFQNEAEKKLAQEYIEHEFDGKLYEWGLLTIRVVDLDVKDTGTRYHLRKYVLGLLPFGDEYTD